MGFDTETTELDPFDGKIRLVQFSGADNTVVIDLRPFEAFGELTSIAELEPLRKLISSKRTHEVNYFWNRTKSNNYRSGDAVLQVMLNDFGKILYIMPPAEYLYTSRNQKTRYYFFEQLRRPEMSTTEFRKKLPASLRKRIDRSGKVSHEVEIALRKAFSK